MNKIILMTGTDYNYLPVIDRYLKSIEINSNFDDNYLIYLKEDNDINIDLGKIKISTANISDIKALTKIKCLQHGEFLMSDSLSDIKDNDIIFFTDGDVFLQRSMEPDEIEFFRSFKDNDIYVGYNASRSDNLNDEYHRLGPNNNTISFLNDIDLSKIKVYNTGIVAMNYKTWDKVSKSYISKFSEIDNKFEHYAKQQWLLSFIFTTENYNIIEMDYDIHNHNIYGIVQGTYYKENSVFYNSKKCLFRHKHF